MEGAVLFLCVLLLLLFPKWTWGVSPVSTVQCWLCMANIVGSFVAVYGVSAGGFFQLLCVLLFALSFWPRDGSVSYIFFILVVGVASNQISSLSLSLTSTCLYLLFSYFFSLFSSQFCYLLHSVCSYNVWLPLLF